MDSVQILNNLEFFKTLTECPSVHRNCKACTVSAELRNQRDLMIIHWSHYDNAETVTDKSKKT